MKRMNVAAVGPSSGIKGGVSKVMSLIMSHTPEHIYIQHVVTFTRYTGDKEANREDRGSSISQAFVFGLAFLRVLMLALGRRTIFHVHFSGRGSLLRKGMICVLLRFTKCQYVIHSHTADTDIFPKQLPVICRSLVLWGLRGAGKIVVLTSFWRQFYSSILGLPDNSFIVLPNPAELPLLVPDRSESLGLKILFLGRIGVRKGVFDLVRAVAALPDDLKRICHLTIAGDGETGEVLTLGKELGCADLLSIPGWIEKDEVEKLLAESDVLVLPSHAEGMAMALIEGMSWGLPLITTNVGGAAEFLEQNTNALLVTPGNVNEISKAIARLANSRELRTRVGAAARETASLFSIDIYMVKLEEIYTELAKKVPRANAVIVAASRM